VTDQAPIVRPLPDYAISPPPAVPSPAAMTTGAVPGGCVDCGQSAANPAAVASPAVAGGYVYAVGRLHARFPSLGAEREYAQLTGADPDAVVHTGQLKDALAVAEHRYLARQMCWVFSGPTADACAVVARDERDLDELIDTLVDDEQVVQALVGSPAGTLSPSPCLAAGLAVMWPDQLLSFSLDEFLDALPGPDEGKPPKGKDAEPWRQTARSLFDHLTRRSENRGLTDEHRAMNYMALRYPQVYHLIFNAQREGKALIGVEPRLAAGGDRRLVDVRFVLRHANTHVVERYFCRVDTTDVFPFLTNPLTLTYD